MPSGCHKKLRQNREPSPRRIEAYVRILAGISGLLTAAKELLNVLIKLFAN